MPQDREPAQRRVVNKGQAGSQNRDDQNPTFKGGSERSRRRKGALNLIDVAGAANGQAFLAITLEILHYSRHSSMPYCAPNCDILCGAAFHDQTFLYRPCLPVGRWRMRRRQR